MQKLVAAVATISGLIKENPVLQFSGVSS